jgi:hypothetical protein
MSTLITTKNCKGRGQASLIAEEASTCPFSSPVIMSYFSRCPVPGREYPSHACYPVPMLQPHSHPLCAISPQAEVQIAASSRSLEARWRSESVS